MAKFKATSQIPPYRKIIDPIELYTQLKHEYGPKNISMVLKNIEKSLNEYLKKIKNLSVDKDLAKEEPNDLKSIKKLRPSGPKRIWKTFDKKTYSEKVEGALLARMAGCTLGAIVEGWQIKDMENWAKEIGDKFPPIDYWSKARNPSHKRYGINRCDKYTRKLLNGVPVDDDIAYTLLGLLIVEDFGPDFSIEDNGKGWLKYLPYACTAEDIALKNLKKGIPATKTAEVENPFCEWIGASIRSDPWGYIAPAWPEKAADMAYRDAYISHRRNGIYGEMFFSAVISAAFAVDNPIDAIKIGLTEIPKNCNLAKAVHWALNIGKRIKNYKEARQAVDEQFKGMHPIHTINNACLSIFGLMIGGTDVTKVLSQTVAMGMDNDCTTATAGSIVGAIVGKKGVPIHWYKNFNNRIYSYLIGKKMFYITDVVRRFTIQAERVFEG